MTNKGLPALLANRDENVALITRARYPPPHEIRLKLFLINGLRQI